METYVVLKVVKTEGINTTVVIRPLSQRKGVGVPATGNLPTVFKGLVFDMKVSNGYIEDYKLQLSPRNIKILEKNKVDVDKYTETLNIHAKIKGYRCGWSVAEKDISEIYNLLPFYRADLIHKEVVNDATDLNRLTHIAKMVRERGRIREKVSYSMQEFFTWIEEIEREGSYPFLSLGEKSFVLADDKFNVTNGIVFDKEIHDMEVFIRENIIERKERSYILLSEDEIQSFINSMDRTFVSEEQVNIIPCLRTAAPVVVTGGAGVGKTTVIKILIDCYATYYNREEILLVAPTGRASRRLAEKTGLAASTIHKALRKTPDDTFIYYNEERKLPYNLIIIDESSMIDTALMKDLLAAVKYEAKIVFVGDHQQLRPVGYGEPFLNFLEGEDPDLRLHVFRLSENHRQDEGTDILAAAEDALHGKHIRCGKGVIVKDIAYEEIRGLLVSDDKTQIISPYHALNDKINDYLHKGTGLSLSVGDKVMTIRNTEHYCNGDIGFVKKVNEEGTTITIDGKDVTVSPDNTRDIVLAYAITVHKMQGSEADKIKVFIPKNDWRTDERMMYTAVTRARKQLEVYYYQPPAVPAEN